MGQGNIILLGSAHVQQRASILCCRHVGSYLMYQLKSCIKSNLIDFILSSHKAALIKSTHFSNLNSGVSSTLKWMEWTLTVLKTLCNRNDRPEWDSNQDPWISGQTVLYQLPIWLSWLYTVTPSFCETIVSTLYVYCFSINICFIFKSKYSGLRRSFWYLDIN